MGPLGIDWARSTQHHAVEDPIHLNVDQAITGNNNEMNVTALGAMTFEDALAFVGNEDLALA